MKPSKVENYIEIAEVVAKRSPDEETQVGAVLVHRESGAILATGFNGFAKNAQDAELPTTRPLKYDFFIHAEQNLIANCVQHSVSTKDCVLICTHSPCKTCMRLIFNCGISLVVVKNLYKDFELLKEMKDISIEVTTDEHGFYIIKYKTKDPTPWI